MKFNKHNFLTYGLDLGSDVVAPFIAAHRKVTGRADPSRTTSLRKNQRGTFGHGYSELTADATGPSRTVNSPSQTVSSPSRTVSSPSSNRHLTVIQPSLGSNLRPIDSFASVSPAQKRKIQSILDFTPQINLISKARYPRIAHNRWLESSIEEFPSVHITGQRVQAIDDDIAINLKIAALKDEFSNNIKDLRAAVKGKLKVELRQVDLLGSCRVIIKTPQGQTITNPDGNTLRKLSIRGGGMELRRALELADAIRTLHKQVVALSKTITKAHLDLTTVVGKHRRRGSTELIFTDKIFKQINNLRVVSVPFKDDGPYCPTPFLQMECFRLHASLMGRAIAGHLTLINRLYNRRTNLKRRAIGTTRPAAFGLSTGRFTYFSLPLLEWRLSLRLKDGRQILRDSVQRTTYSKVRGRMLLEKTEQVATPDGSLSMPAVAYASLLHMADEYHCIEAARFAFTKVVNTVSDSARSFMSTRSNCASNRGEWTFSEHVITPNQLQIPTHIAA